MTPDFDGATYEPARDKDRLTAQLASVRMFMWDGDWHTLKQIATAVQCPEASASARLRDLRKPRFGAFTIERRRVTDGLHEYRMGTGQGVL